jgi:shikimate dehydrogenase
MATRAGVIGWPIRHSLSPAIFTAAFAATDLDWVYDAFEVPEGEAAGLVAKVRDELAGLSVTMPHKAAVIPALDDLTPTARELGAVNCIARDGGRLVGHSTDGAGLVDSLRLDDGIELSGRRVVLLGAGGAGRAVARAVGAEGAEVVVVNRSPEPAAKAARLAGPAARVGTAAEVAGADVVINATSLGMGDDGRLPFDPAFLGAGQVVVDLVYHPAVTPLLAAAGAAGARAVGGLGMLVHQAAHAFRLWTGEEPPLSAMRAGAERGLARRDGAG